ncbi:DUF1203 domain-containing protein [Tahibacter amnicola]|uniref:DUF1203 domain-containing protein n=1 Tax=Tahibacter amnicola TaxID=2976241 RepID=A0ABY6B931_9GAMM|nr:DUF1203 domain-containing protein [Tahibacter amnicola]UXI66573.1 DUF1203 domain-containing protein [Tahibacter amnicola]
MTYRIRGLETAPFSALFGLSDEALAAQGVRRYTVDRKGAFPDRIELRDLEPGESVLLLNFTHLPARSPYRASHAIYVKEGAEHPFDAVGEVPEVMKVRLISLRAYDKDDWMVDADITEGEQLPTLINRFFADARVAYLHAHYARRGCFAARIDRV